MNEVPPLRGVLETCLYVDDLPRAAAFYRDVLGLALVSVQADRHLFFRCGRQMLLLFSPSASELPNAETPPHGARGPGHIAFEVEAEALPQWRGRLDAAQVAIEKEIAWPGGGRSIYFRDPAGNSLELATRALWEPADADHAASHR